jgi:hypothetical protein
MTPKKYNKGAATLELLIAFAILVLNITAVMLLINGGQSIYVDTETNNEALTKAQSLLEKTKSDNYTAVADCDDSTSTKCVGTVDSFYNRKLIIDPASITECGQDIKTSTSWTTSGKTLSVDLNSHLSDLATVVALGGDCTSIPSESDWDTPARFASDTMSPGKPTSIDVLNRIAYLGADKSPFLYIGDTTSVTKGQNNGIFTTFSNSFDLGAKPNSIDVAKLNDPLTGTQKIYAFFAMDTATNQLKVVDVTNINKPVLVSTVPLSSCVSGAAPEGWRLYVYKDRLYFLTRFTAGPEFHVFNISDPNSPSEIGSGACKGFDLGDTAESIEVRDQTISGTTMRFVYLATDESDKELKVLNVTNPASISEVTSANQDLPGTQDGQSVYLTGNKLFLGRQSTPSGPDLYVYNISNPTLGLPNIGSKDIGTGVIGIRAVGKLIFLATSKVNKEFQVWNIASLSNIFLIKEYNFGNVVSQGIDYEPDWVYATGQSTPNFQILYDSTP